MPAREFVQYYLVQRLGAREVVIGHDYRFGRNREGNIALLQTLGAEFGFPVHVVDAIQINNTVVSSTLIRNLIREGKVSAAQVFLGRPYEVTGEVIRGHGRGARLLGFPTANLAVDNGLLVPAAGIYAVRVELRGQIFPAVANIGICPTFNNQELSLEVFLMDFDQDIYGARAGRAICPTVAGRAAFCRCSGPGDPDKKGCGRGPANYRTGPPIIDISMNYRVKLALDIIF